LHIYNPKVQQAEDLYILLNAFSLTLTLTLTLVEKKCGN